MPQWLPKFIVDYLSELKLDLWIILGFIGMALFSSRFIVQWIASERKKESIIPISFWYLSIVGSLVMLSYSMKRADVVFILSYLFNSFVYVRNLYFIYRKRRLEALAR